MYTGWNGAVRPGNYAGVSWRLAVAKEKFFFFFFEWESESKTGKERIL